MISAHAIQGYREKCLTGGMDGYVSKPIRVETLRQAIECFLHGPVVKNDKEHGLISKDTSMQAL